MTRRAALRNQYRPLHRFGYTIRDQRLGSTASLLPKSVMTRLVAVIFALAAFGLFWSMTSEGGSVLAEADAPTITGTVKAN